MKTKMQAHTKNALSRSSATPASTGLLQRKCACGNHTIAGGECAACGKTKRLGLQTKLTVNEPGDTYEQEADRIADQVLATPAHPAVSAAPPRIQRFSGQSNGQTAAAPASVDQALASPGRPLEPALRQDMEQRFGHDFSRVRVHSGAVAEQSAQDVNADAYTVGHNMVFGVGRFVPGTHAGRRLLAHELAHVVQQRHATAGGPLSMSRPGDLAEHEAETAARAALSGRQMSALTPIGRGLARSPDDDTKDRPLRSSGLTKAEWAKIKDARKHFKLTPSKSTLVGILILEDGEEIRIRSGEGGPEGGTERGGIPRGRGEAFTGGGPSQGNIATHVEGKAAKIMHERKISRATLIIEEKPCDVCENIQSKRGPGSPNISAALPPGSRLTIVDPETTGHYWSSQRPGVGAVPAAPATRTKTSSTTAAAPTSGTSQLPKGSVFETKTPTPPVLHKTHLPKGSIFETHPIASTPKVDTESPPAKGAPVPAKPTKAGPAANVGAAVPEGGSVKVGRVTVDYNLNSSDPKRGIKLTNIDLSDYPPAKEGPVTRFLVNNSPALQKLTSVSTTVLSLAGQAAGGETEEAIQKVLEPIQSYFGWVLEEARKEFLTQFPDTASLLLNAGIDQHRKVYEAAAAKLRVPEHTRVAAAVMLALVPDKDRDAAWHEMVQNLDKFGVVRAGDVRRYLEAGSAYEKVMADLLQQLSKYEEPLPNIAEDISKRASVLQRAGQDLEDVFWSLMTSPAAAFPFVYYQLWGIYRVSGVFQRLGANMGVFAAAINSRTSGYQHLRDLLDEQLVQVGTQLNNFGGASPRSRGRAQ